MTIIQKNDFVEIEFVGKLKDSNEVFDTNSKAEIEKKKLKFEAKPYFICVGKSMSIKGLDKDIEGKEVGKEYSVEFKPEDAFGKRNPSLIRMVPLKLFIEQKIMPQKGMQMSLDGAIVKVISVSGGRVLVDFNNPLAGKVVSYNYKITRKLEEEKEKVNALQDFFFRRRFEFEVKSNEVIFKVEENLKKFIEIMAKPFEDILGMKIKIEVAKKEQNK